MTKKRHFPEFYVEQHTTFQKSFQTLWQKICSCTQKVVTLQSVMRDDVHAESTLSFLKIIIEVGGKVQNGLK